MSNVQVKNVDPDLHQRLRERAAELGQPIGEYVLELIRRDLQRPSQAAWRRRVARLPMIAVDIDVVQELNNARDER